MEIRCLSTGILNSNCYIVWEESVGVIIDAGAPIEEIMKVVKDNSLDIKYIILTHGHIDHIYSVDELREQTGAKVTIHKNENIALIDPKYNGSSMFWVNEVFREADELLKDGDVITVGNLKLEIIHTPGHSMGSICIRIGNKMFTGDTLFSLAQGRTDLLGGNQNEMDNSFKNKLLKLDDKIEVYPGHGDSTTIGFEKQFNPYVRSLGV